MTPNKAIEKVDTRRPNPYDEETKLSWLSDLDGTVKRLIYEDKDIKAYSYPEDMDTELAIPFPFDNLYELYIESMIDYYNREYANYNNSATLFEGRFAEFKKLYIRENKVKG